MSIRSAPDENGFVRQLDTIPAFDFVREGEIPGQSYGIGALRLRFILIGPKGAVQWMIGTDWHVKSARDRLTARHFHSPFDAMTPQGWDLGYHSPAPRYEGQEPMPECDILDHGRCYYDGSGLNAELLLEGFIAGGDEWVWSRLEAYYRHTFEDAPWPDFTPIYRPHPSERAS